MQDVLRREDENDNSKVDPKLFITELNIYKHKATVVSELRTYGTVSADRLLRIRQSSEISAARRDWDEFDDNTVGLFDNVVFRHDSGTEF